MVHTVNKKKTRTKTILSVATADGNKRLWWSLALRVEWLCRCTVAGEWRRQRMRREIASDAGALAAAAAEALL